MFIQDFHSQVTDEVQALQLSMKRQAIGLVNEPKKVILGGYSLRSFNTKEMLAMNIVAILGIDSYKDKVVSINFTRHEETKVSHTKSRHLLLLYSWV